MTEWRHPPPSLQDPDDLNNNDRDNESVATSNKANLWVQLNQQAELRAKNHFPPTSLPSMDHFTRSDFEHVYHPSDDTFLLIDALDYEISSGNLNHLLQVPIVTVLEIGCGSGVPSIVFKRQFLKHYNDITKKVVVQHEQEQAQEQPSTSTPIPTPNPFLLLRTLATDVNPRALRATQQTWHQNTVRVDDDDQNNNNNTNNNNLGIELVQCDLATNLLPRLMHQVDVLIFNPPYVPTPDDEIPSLSTFAPSSASSSSSPSNNRDDTPRNKDSATTIAAAWAGGQDGRRVIDRFVTQQMALLLTPQQGVAYMVTVDDNRPFLLSQTLYQQYQLQMQPLYRRKACNEQLTIQKITWAGP